MQRITSCLTSMQISTLQTQEVVLGPAEQFTMKQFTGLATLILEATRCSSSLTRL